MSLSEVAIEICDTNSSVILEHFSKVVNDNGREHCFTCSWDTRTEQCSLTLIVEPFLECF